MSFSIAGTVGDGSGNGVGGASVRLVGSQSIMGNVAGAQNTGQPYTWSRVIDGGDVGQPPNDYRFICYTKFVKDVIPSNVLSDNAFYSQVLEWNQQLAADGNHFVDGKIYFIPTPDGGPQFQLTTTTDGAGNYRFDGLSQPGVYGLIVEKDGYIRSLMPIEAFQPQLDTQNPPPIINVNLVITPQAAPPPQQQRIFSTEPGLAQMPAAIQRLVQQALLLITSDEKKAFDLLPPDLQSIAFGFGKPQGSINFKDIVCADIISICYRAALGRNPAWPSRDDSGRGFTNLHCANFYTPYPGLNDDQLQALSGRVPTLSVNDDWKPGDVIVYWGPNDIISPHVNMYIGRFAGTDLDGKSYSSGEPYVINTSMNFAGNDRYGPQVSVFRLSNAVTGFGFATRQHVRIRDLWR